MKKIKKLLCIMLAALLLASVGTVAAGAEESVQPDMEALQQKFIAYLDEQGWLTNLKKKKPPKCN